MSKRTYQGECWPTSSQEYLLKAALLTDPLQVQEAWTQWRQIEDFENLDIGSFKLLPKVYHNLTQHNIQDDITGRLKGIRRKVWYRNKLLFHSCYSIVEKLQSADIPVLMFKGTALIAKGYYSDSGLRPMSDTDLLIPAAAAEQAVNLFFQNGWSYGNPVARQRYAGKPISEYIRYRHNGLTFKNPQGHEIDLHWQIKIGYRPVATEFFERAEQLNFDGLNVLGLSDTDHLLLICAHGIAWNTVPPLRWVIDAMLIINSGQVDWEQLVIIAERSRLVLPLKMALDYLGSLLDANIPPTALDKLHQLSVPIFESVLMWGKTHSKYAIRGPVIWAGLYSILYRDYCLETQNKELKLNPRTFLEFLQKIWGLENIRDIPQHAFSRISAKFSNT